MAAPLIVNPGSASKGPGKVVDIEGFRFNHAYGLDKSRIEAGGAPKVETPEKKGGEGMDLPSLPPGAFKGWGNYPSRYHSWRAMRNAKLFGAAADQFDHVDHVTRRSGLAKKAAAEARKKAAELTDDVAKRRKLAQAERFEKYAERYGKKSVDGTQELEKMMPKTAWEKAKQLFGKEKPIGELGAMARTKMFENLVKTTETQDWMQVQGLIKKAELAGKAPKANWLKIAADTEAKVLKDTGVTLSKNADALEKAAGGVSKMGIIAKGVGVVGLGATAYQTYNRVQKGEYVGAVAEVAHGMANPIAVKALSKGLEKAVEKGILSVGAKTLSKKVPVIAAFAGAYFAYERAKKGDWMGAGLEAASGALGAFGLGWLGLGVDAALVAYDVSGVGQNKTLQTAAKASLSAALPGLGLVTAISDLKTAVTNIGTNNGQKLAVMASGAPAVAQGAQQVQQTTAQGGIMADTAKPSRGASRLSLVANNKAAEVAEAFVKGGNGGKKQENGGFELATAA